MDEIILLDKLKDLILFKNGISRVSPADCQKISENISTGDAKISITTIKRLFGFTKGRHNFSQFTVATLMAYVQEDLLRLGSSSRLDWGEETIKGWAKIQTNALKITRYTLEEIKSRPGIPFDRTISRAFAEHHLEDFLENSCSFTAFISQPGYGRTILMSHLVEKIIHKPELFNNSTALFLKARRIFSNDTALSNLEEYLKMMLKIHPSKSLLEYANENYENSGGQLLIFLDGFSEFALSAENNIRLFESLINFICDIDESKSIKLILSMRTTVWIRFHERFSFSAYLRNKWFRGNYYSPSEATNVPQLADKEIDLILSKNTQFNTEVIDAKLRKQLKLPLQFHFYDRLRQEDPGFDYSTNFTFLELTGKFVTEKIYKSINYTQKVILLHKIVACSDYGRKGIYIEKQLLIDDINQNEQVYDALLCEGILVEQKCYGDIHPTVYIHFINTHLFEYFLFIELLGRFNSKIDHLFFEYIDQEYKHNPLGFQLLQWALKFIIKAADFEALSIFFKLELSSYEKKYLILHIAENLDYRNKISSTTKQALQDLRLHQAILEAISNLDFVDPYYKKAINLLIPLTDDKELLETYHTILLTFDILSMKSEHIRLRLNILSEINSNSDKLSFEIGYGILSKMIGMPMPSISIIKKFRKLFDGERTCAEIRLPANLSSSYFMMLLSTLINGDTKDTITTIRTIANRHPKISFRNSSFAVLVMSIFTFCSARIDPGKRTDQLENILSKAVKNDLVQDPGYTHMMIKMVEIVQAKNKGDYMMAESACQKCLDIFRSKELHLNALMTYDLIIEIFKQKNDSIRVTEYADQRLCYLQDNNISNVYFC